MSETSGPPAEVTAAAQRLREWDYYSWYGQEDAWYHDLDVLVDYVLGPKS